MSLLDLKAVKVYPLETRRSLSSVDEILIDPRAPAPDWPAGEKWIRECADRVVSAVKRRAAVLLIYGAHLLRNGATLILQEMMARGWITHLATNGAGSIHDWEYAYLGRSTEDVRANVASGTFGTWDETGRFINLALLAGGLRGEGYGEAVGRFILEDGTELPQPAQLAEAIRNDPGGELTPGRAELLWAMGQHGLAGGRVDVQHRWKQASLIGNALKLGVPFTVHPGIGYDIISNHPMFNGAAIGRAAQVDFQKIGATIERLDGGVVLSIGSAIMAPQVFEKALSCVNNLRRQAGQGPVAGHTIYVVDLQEGGAWDWRRGEPPKTNPAYYLRFCKSFSRMGGAMEYIECDNLTFIHHLYHRLQLLQPA